MDIDADVKVTYENGEIEIKQSLSNLGKESIALHSFCLNFPDGTSVDMILKDASRPNLPRVEQEMLLGHPFWFRAQIQYSANQNRLGCLIKDFCVQCTDSGDIVATASKVRKQEAMGVLAYRSQDFQTASQHFDAALRVYEAEECPFAIMEMMQIHAYVLLFTGRGEEAAFHLRAVLEMVKEKKMTQTQMRLLGNLANIQLNQGQAIAARHTYEQVFEAAAELDVGTSIGFAEAGIGNSYKLQGDRKEAEKWLRRAVATARDEEDRVGLANRLGTLGYTLEEMGQHEAATECLVESLTFAMDIGQFQNLEGLCMYLWEACRATGDASPFVTICERLLKVLPEHVAIETRVHVLIALANVYSERSEHERAIQQCKNALAIARRTGNQYSEMVVLKNLGGYYFSIGQYLQAQELLRESMQIAARNEAWPLANAAKAHLAKVIAESGNDLEEKTAEREYTEILSNWWFSQTLPDDTTK